MNHDLLKRLKLLEERIRQDELEEAQHVYFIDVILSKAVKPPSTGMSRGAVAGAAKGTSPEKTKRSLGTSECVIPAAAGAAKGTSAQKTKRADEVSASTTPKAAGSDISSEQPAEGETPDPSDGKLKRRKRRIANSFYRVKMRKGLRRPPYRP